MAEAMTGEDQQQRASEQEPSPQAGPQHGAPSPGEAAAPATKDPRKSADMLGREAVQDRAPGMRYGDAAAGLAPAPAAVMPLPGNVRSAMERSFGHNFSDVRVHPESPKAKDVGARAFTQGRDIYFAPGAYQPETEDGKRLLAHELTHVVQQSGGAAEQPVTSPEEEAEHAADAAVAGKPVQVSRGAVPFGTRQNEERRPPSQRAVQNATERRQSSDVNRTGDFNLGGKASGNEYEFVKNGGKYYVRRKPQATKDANTVRAAGGDPDSTRKPGALKPQNDSSATILDASADAKVAAFQTPEGGTELASGRAGTLTAEGEALSAGASADASASVGPDGLEVKAGAAVNLTLVNGKLAWTLPTAEFTILGEKLKAQFGTELSAEVAASASGNVALTAGKKDGGVAVQASGGGEAFAGARAGFKLFGKGMWVTPEGEKDFVGAFAGVEGWAGAAAAAQFTASLVPKIKFEGYLGAAVGVGASCKVGVEAHLYHIGALGYTLARKGLPAAFAGLEAYADQITDWLANGAAWLYEAGAVYVDAVSTSLLGDSDAIDAVNRRLHLHMRPQDRAGLINRMMAGTCFDEEEDAIIRILRDSKARRELWAVMRHVEGGSDAILWALDGAQDTEARQILGLG